MQKAMQNFWVHRDRCCHHSYNLGRNLELSVATFLLRLSKLDFVIKSRQRNESYSVLVAITTFCDREVTDPRDRVYGMLGLGSGPYTDLMSPNYSLCPEQICHAIAIESVERTGKLEFLSHLFDHQNRKLPSFIPNWTGDYDWFQTYENRFEFLPMFNASLDIPADLKVISWDMISLAGLIFDTVTTTGSKVGDVYSLDFLQELNRLAPSEELSEESYCHTKQPLKCAFLHNMCGGVELILDEEGSRSTRRMNGSTDLQKLSAWNSWITAPARLQGELFDDDLSKVSSILTDIQNCTNGRRFFTTRRGYFGFGPAKCAEGDLVAIMAGGDVPYMIRPVSPAVRRLSMIRQHLAQELVKIQGKRSFSSKDGTRFLGTHMFMELWTEKFSNFLTRQRDNWRILYWFRWSLAS
jgi:hypothetical protein